MPDDATDAAPSLLDWLSSLHDDSPSGPSATRESFALLWAIGRAAARKDRLVDWHKAKRELRELLQAHDLPDHAIDDFATLSQSPIWELTKARDTSQPRGGLESSVYELLVTDPKVRGQAVTTLLENYFTEEPWEGLLLATGLTEEPFDGFGHPPYVPVGMHFRDRRALHSANAHAPIQGGIWGKAREEAKSIVVSGGYEDDEDFGNEIIYTGQGGQDESGRQVRDQDLTRGNAALVNSMATGRPIRVIRGANGDPAHSPLEGLRYDGLYRVEEHWSQRGASGFRVWRYRLRAIETKDGNAAANASQLALPIPKAPSPDSLGEDEPGRKTAVIQRVIRSTAVANRVKRIHDHTCQICGTRIETPTGAYSEAAHIRPLGRPHNGRDRTNNVLCLCPNHHVAFDFGMITIDASGKVVEHGVEQHNYVLRRHDDHEIAEENFEYHRDHHESRND
ncbi:YDG/SRA domain-containing protein [Streptomyces olivoreticuli]|uniref:YDG/SRA domain-containing protein n=1 Tax=Streptomyces olivoreticuli TaxID=68246 RepID=UPI0026589BBF|nr:YDG/SRA domain-containing protein [Streptomyces olivoreticuli]WKK21022.1 YDG/SRA domain-containing protein [Streptomyces olivoreticuli]